MISSVGRLYDCTFANIQTKTKRISLFGQVHRKKTNEIQCLKIIKTRF